MLSRIGTPLTALVIAAGTSGCFAVVDVDRFHQASGTLQSDGGANEDGPVAGQFEGLKLTFLGMRPHLTQLTEFRIIDSTMFIQSRGVINPLGVLDSTYNMPLAIPPQSYNGPFHLDFYADVDGSGGYDGIGSVITNDHAWRIDPLADYPADSVTPIDGLVQVTFTHNTSFTDIDQYPSGTPNLPKDTTLGATIHIVNAGEAMGALVEARVLDTSANHTVGLFRMPAIAQPAFDMVIPGVVEPGEEYAVSVYLDANANGTYDNPATGLGDLGWTISGTADNTGLSVTADLSATQTGKVDVGEP